MVQFLSFLGAVVREPPSETLPSAEMVVEVPFYDVDMLGIVWHGHYVKYFEQVRCALLDKIGYDYLTMKETGYVWPVVELRLKYMAPARFGERLNVRAVLKEYEYRMKIGYEITDTSSGRRLARGTTIQVAVSVETGEMCFGSPEVFRKKIEKFQPGSDTGPVHPP